jgi:RNA ligase
MFTRDDFVAEVDAGHVRVKKHPEGDLYIANYTEKAQYSRAWNDVTRACRGLIYETDGTIVARPFAKFFNLGEHPDFNLNRLLTGRIFDKVDGSLGILYTAPDGRPAIATRGSFVSEQALFATEWYRNNADGYWEPNEDLTYLFEIIYPNNRIVVDYGDYKGLIALAAIDKATGLTVHDAHHETPMVPTPSYTFDAADADELLALLTSHRDNAEGFVIHLEDDTRVKIKHDEYVRLHRILTGLSERTIWLNLSEGGSLDEILEVAPDELYDWVTNVADDLKVQHRDKISQAIDIYATVVDSMLDSGVSLTAGADPKVVRREFAIRAQTYTEVRPALFLLFDNRSIDAWAWAAIKPEATKPFAVSEDTA